MGESDSNPNLDERLLLTKARLAAASWCQNLEELTYHSILRNISFYLQPNSLISYLPNMLRQELLKELEIKMKRNESFEYDDRPINEALFKQSLAMVELLLSPETKEFELDWLLAMCPFESRPLYSKKILLLLKKLAPNLSSLTIGRKLPEDSNFLPPVPAMDTEMLTLICKLCHLTQLCLGKFVFSDYQLTNLLKELPRLTHLSCCIYLTRKVAESNDVLNTVKHLKAFTFNGFKPNQAGVVTKPDPIYVLESDLVFNILKEAPQRMVVLRKYADEEGFSLPIQSHVLLKPIPLQHLSINLEQPLTEAQWKNLPDVMYLKIGSSSHLEASSDAISAGFKLLLKFPKLKSLHVGDDIGARRFVQLLQTYGQNLESLCWYGEAAPELRLREISALCPNLKKLKYCGQTEKDVVQDVPQDYFRHLKNLHWAYSETVQGNEIVKLLKSAPNLEKVVLDKICLSIPDLHSLSALVEDKMIFKKLTTFHFYMGGNQKSLVLAGSELVKNICAYAPNVVDVKFDHSVSFYENYQLRTPAGSASKYAAEHPSFGEVPNLAEFLGVFKSF